jgi:uncharacterized membrane protein YozB (DUF420 family)
MILGIISVIIALYIIKFKKGNKSRIKMHKLFMGIGFSLLLIAVLIMFFGKEADGLNHFIVPHAFGGIFVLILMITSITLATMGLKGNKKLLDAHRWVGRVTAIFLIIAAVFGLIVLLGYI